MTIPSRTSTGRQFVDQRLVGGVAADPGHDLGPRVGAGRRAGPSRRPERGWRVAVGRRAGARRPGSRRRRPGPSAATRLGGRGLGGRCGARWRRGGRVGRAAVRWRVGACWRGRWPGRAVDAADRSGVRWWSGAARRRGRRSAEERQLELPAIAAEAAAAGVDARQATRCAGERRGPGRPSIPVGHGRDQPFAQPGHHLLGERDQRRGPRLPAGRGRRCPRGHRRLPGHPRTRSTAASGARPSRSARAAASMTSSEVARTWSSSDSASRMPPAARRAMSSRASGSATRPSASRMRVELALDLLRWTAAGT